MHNSKKLKCYLEDLAQTECSVSQYVLRIGGRTWYLIKNLDRQFVYYLGTWASPEASARYFRASPRSVLRMLHKFYRTTSD